MYIDLVSLIARALSTNREQKAQWHEIKQVHRSQNDCPAFLPSEREQKEEASNSQHNKMAVSAK